MKIIHELLSALQTDADVLDIRQGVFHTGVLTRACGLAATLPRDALRQKSPLVKEPDVLMEKSAFELARMVFSESILEASIGMATINSLLDINMDACRELNARELLMEKGEGKRVAIVGHFPFISELRRQTKKLWVIEKNPREGDFPETEADQLIPRAEVVALTGSAFSNHTIAHLLELCRPSAYVVILGDTTPLSSILFDYGVDALCGTKVVDPQRALRCISAGANFRQIKGTSRLTMMR